jgi:hypothetical protein
VWRVPLADDRPPLVEPAADSGRLRVDHRSVAVVDPAGTTWRSAGWPLLLVVFVVLPGAAVFGNWAILHLFGNGSYLPIDSIGDHVLHWWEGWGRPLLVGMAAWLLLTICRISPVKSALLALGSAAASFVWLYGALIVFLMLNPGALD